jgi:hypothetical protein
MELIATFYTPDTIDCYTFVFDELNPGGYHTMLAMSADGHTFSQWTSGVYEPGAANEHLGRRVTLQSLGRAALDGLLYRLSVPDDYEAVHHAIEQLLKERREERE